MSNPIKRRNAWKNRLSPLLPLLVSVLCGCVPPLAIDKEGKELRKIEGLEDIDVEFISFANFDRVVEGRIAGTLNIGVVALGENEIIFITGDMRRSESAIWKVLPFTEIEAVGLSAYGRGRQIQIRTEEELLAFEVTKNKQFIDATGSEDLVSLLHGKGVSEWHPEKYYLVGKQRVPNSRSRPEDSSHRTADAEPTQSNKVVDLLLAAITVTASVAAGFTCLIVGLCAVANAAWSLKFILRQGCSEFRRWLLPRDLRVWQAGGLLVVAFFLLTNEIGVWWLYAIFAHAFLNIVKSFSPPCIVVLHSFDDRNYWFAKTVAFAFPGLNVISLSPGKDERRKRFWEINTALAGIGSKQAEDSEWECMVEKYLDWSSLILIDVTHARVGVRKEGDFILSKPDRNAKSLFVVREGEELGESMLEELIRQADIRHHHLPHSASANEVASQLMRIPLRWSSALILRPFLRYGPPVARGLVWAKIVLVVCGFMWVALRFGI